MGMPTSRGLSVGDEHERGLVAPSGAAGPGVRCNGWRILGRRGLSSQAGLLPVLPMDRDVGPARSVTARPAGSRGIARVRPVRHLPGVPVREALAVDDPLPASTASRPSSTRESTIPLSDGTSKRWTRWNGWREWRITSRIRASIARSFMQRGRLWRARRKFPAEWAASPVVLWP